MDVRCEKCQTEYELDEGKLKPGGVTVKCTTCGHMFRVRPSAVPRAEAAAPSAPVPSAPMKDHRTPTPSSSGRASSVLMDAEEGERTWLIRLEDGEIKTCRELSTLQKWIVSGRVSRSCSISRTGKKWKLLGEIGELASFFGIADEARDARSPRWGGASATREYPAPPGPDGSFGSLPSSSAAHPRTVPRRSTAEPSAPLHLDEPEGRVGGRYGNGEAHGDGDGDGADEEDETAPASYADALAAEMERATSGAALGAAPGGFAQTLRLGGAPPVSTRPGTGADPIRHGGVHHGAAQMKAQAPPPDLLGDVPPELSAPIPADLPIDDELSEPGPVGSLPTLPPYGAGILDAPSSRPAPRSSGLPLAPPPSRPATSSASPSPDGPTTGGWASRGSVGGGMRDHGPSGPTGGKAHGDGDEAAFVGRSKMPNIRGEFEDGKFVPSPFVDDEPLLPRRSSGALWVVLFSLVVMAGAAGAVYLVMYQGDDEAEVATTPTEPTAPVTPPTDTTAPVIPPVTETPVTPPVTPGEDKAADDAVAAALAAIVGDSPAGLASAGQTLAALSPDGPPGPIVLVARARVEAALAQQLADRAKLAAPAEGRKLLAQAKSKARASRQLAEQALQARAGDGAALVAVADARRLEGERSIEVERWLRKAQQSPTGAELAGEIELVTAQLRVRDDRLRDARVVLAKLAAAAPAGDERARFRLAWLDYLDSNAEAARTGVEAVLKAQADHGGARALLEKLGDKPPVEGGDPMPPEDKGDKPGDKVADKPADKPGDKVADKPADKPGDKGDKAPAGDSFDQVLDRAQKLAENGNCNAAMPLYRKVLDLHPAAVEALTGLGYCHLDRREYASAHTRFRAALGISSRYQPAMWGIAEAYQQQGMKAEALERFQAFVSEHPNGPRADSARERIANLRRELGSSEGGSSGSSGSDSTGADPSGSDSSGSDSSGQGTGDGSSSEPPAGGSGEGEGGAGESAAPGDA